MAKRLFHGTRKFTVYEDVEVLADNEHEAREMIEDDHDNVKVIEEREDDYEIMGHLIEVMESK